MTDTPVLYSECHGSVLGTQVCCRYPMIPMHTLRGTVEHHLSGCWLSRLPIIGIGLALPVNLLRILKNELALKLPYFSDHKTHHDFSLDILEKNNEECILILVIYWKKTGLVHTKISNHNIIYSS